MLWTGSKLHNFSNESLNEDGDYTGSEIGSRESWFSNCLCALAPNWMPHPTGTEILLALLAFGSVRTI